MESLKFILVLIFLLNFMPGSLSHRQPWKIHFYVHDVFSGKNQTIYEVAKANVSDQLASRFGVMSVVDDVVTCDPDIESKQLGRIQGTVVFSDLKEMSIDMLLNLVFTEGKYNGSTLNIFGRNPFQEEVREVSIVGGTGAFRMARGYIIITTYAVEEGGVHNIFEYRATVFHG